MLPKWFNLWNRENPTNVFGPAILVGVWAVQSLGNIDSCLGPTLCNR